MYKRLSLLFIILCNTCIMCNSSARYTRPSSDTSTEVSETTSDGKDIYSEKVKGKASYYGKKFHGNPTASGERFDMNKMTAAHRTLPFGTRVKVTNLRNKRSITLRINDRGPFKKDRILDMSKAAAKKLGILETGTATVTMEVVK